MSETKDTDDKRSTLSSKTLSMRRSVDTSHVRQNFSHGRSKAVLVEKKRKRSIAAPGVSEHAAAQETAPEAPAAAAPQSDQTPAPDRTGVVLRTLTEEEKGARAQALAEARAREADERREAVIEAERRRVEDERRRKEETEAEVRRTEEETLRVVDEEARVRAEPEVKRKPVEPAVVVEEDEEDKRGGDVKKGRKRGEEVRPVPVRKTEAERRQGKLTISNALDDTPRQRSLASIRRKQERAKKQAMGVAPPAKISREVVVPEAITIQELANRMAERAVDLIRLLMQQGQMLKINDVIDADMAELLAREFGHTVKRVSEADVEEGIQGEDDEEGTLLPRAPVVTVMGHVDHGKTSLLDALRKTKVAAGEAGGITQHIGAYQVETQTGQTITFIDTPGHAAFTAMRARGAKATDLVILVVAADDGVMPQTIEAINHAKAANVPIIVAINKMDKPGADPQRVRTELLQHEIVTESMSGDTLEVEVSALKGTNLDKLLEAIQLQAEILELRANPDRSADGVVVEAKIDKGRGPVATVLVQRGTLRIGDIFIAGSEWGRVRALVGDAGQPIDEAGPSLPVEILGFNGAPDAGDQFAVVENEARAREITAYRQRKRRDVRSTATARGSFEQMMTKLKDVGRQEFPILIKSDVQGSAEAIVGALEKLGNDEISARVVHSGVGAITESDVTLATASEAVIIGFNVRANQQAREAAQQAGIEIRYYNVIYHLVDDVKAVMTGMLPPGLREEFLGNAEVLEVFNISKVGKVAGCRVTEGSVERGAKVRLIRDSVVIHEGTLSTLKRFKDEVREVKAGQECGMAFEKYEDLRAGDVIECYRVEEVARTLD
jgi:translation initiation factor IF-2